MYLNYETCCLHFYNFTHTVWKRKNYFPTEKRKSERCLNCLKIKGITPNTVYKEIQIFYIKKKTICTHFKNLNLPQTPAVRLLDRPVPQNPLPKNLKFLKDLGFLFE